MRSERKNILVKLMPARMTRYSSDVITEHARNLIRFVTVVIDKIEADHQVRTSQMKILT